MQLTYQGLKITVPYRKVIQVEDFCLQEAVNSHAEAELTLLVPEEERSRMIGATGPEDTVTIQDGEGKQLFHGLIKKAEEAEEKSMACLRLSCVSHTYKWDLEKHSRTFQDLEADYDTILKQVLKPYPNAGIQNMAASGKKTGVFLLQYEETDWEFLKRLATRFGTFLFVDAKASHGRVYFGLPAISRGVKLDKKETRLRKDLRSYYFFNAKEDYFPQETIKYMVETKKSLSLGEQVQYGRLNTIVTGICYRKENGALLRFYELSRKKGVRCPRMDNPQIYGMSIPATVKERDGNCVRVHFDIDPAYEAASGNRFFTYAIESSSMYCMPEEGSRVHVYFPGSSEEEAVAVHAVRSGGGGGAASPDSAPGNGGFSAMASSPGSGGASSGGGGGLSGGGTPAGNSAPSGGASGGGGGGGQKAANPDEKSFSNVTGSELLMNLSELSLAADAGKEIALFLKDDGSLSLKGKKLTFSADTKISIGDGGEEGEPVKKLTISSANYTGFQMDGDETQGFTMDQELRLIGALLKKEAAVKKAPAIPLSAFDHSEEDAKALEDVNAAAEQQLVEKQEEASNKIRSGIMSILKTAAIVAVAAVATVATGGAAAPLVAACVLGAAKTVIDVSNVAEGIQDYGKSQKGDLSQSYNFVRDTVCQGNEALYGVLCTGVDIAFGIVSSIATGSLANLGKLKYLTEICGKNKILGMLSHLGMDAFSSIYDSYMQNGCIDWKNLGVSLLAGSLKGSLGQGFNAAFLDKLGLDGLGRKAAGFFSGTGIDTAMDAFIYSVCGEDFDLMESLKNNAFANVFTALFGEPVDAVTGAYLLTATDLVLPGIAEDFALKREYRSARHKCGLFGKGWQTRWESRLSHDGRQMHLTAATGHTMCFSLEGDVWVNQTPGCGRFSLEADVPAGIWRLYDGAEHRTYTYSREGFLLSETDQNGGKTVLSYTDGVLSEIRTALGARVSLETEGGRITGAADSLGRKLTYRYEGDLLVEVVQLSRGTTRYAYDASGYLESATDCNGVAYLRNEYDKEGRVVFQELANGDTYRAFYDTENRSTTVWQEPLGKRTEWEYSGDLLVTCARYQDGTKERYEYDGENQRCLETDRLGNTRRTERDRLGREIRVTEPDGLVREYAYDESGNLVLEKDSSGREKRYTYDTRHNRTCTREKLSPGNWRVLSWEYDSLGRLLLETDACGNTTSYTYREGEASPASRTDGEGHTARYTYDGAGRRLSVENPYGRVEYGYDDAGNLTRERDGLGNETIRVYDRMGKPVSMTLPEGGTWGYRYDFMDRLVQVDTPEGASWRQERDGEGRVTRQYHPETGEETRSDYDPDGNRIREVRPDGSTVRYFYDACGRVEKEVQPEDYVPELDGGPGTCYTYDSLGRVTQETDAEGNPVRSLVYDAAGNPVQETDAEGNTTLREYDLAGNLTAEKVPVDAAPDGTPLYRITCYEYDANGDRILEQQGLDAVPADGRPRSFRTIRYGYDHCRRLSHVEDGEGACLRYAYDCVGQRVLEVRRTSAGEQVIRYAYDAAGNRTGQTEELPDGEPGKRLAVTRMAYDRDGRRTLLERPEGGRTEFRYDRGGRLVWECDLEPEKGIRRTTAYRYDRADRLVHRETGGRKEDFRYDSMDRLTHAAEPGGGTRRLLYDATGRLLKEIQPGQYDPARDDGPGTAYRYDRAGNVLEVRDALGNRREENTYDRLGRLLEQADALGNRILLRRRADGALCAAEDHTGKVLQAAAYNAAGHMAETVDGNGNRTWYRTDAWGRVTEVCPADGTVERYAYGPAGETLATTDGNGGTIRYAYNTRGLVSSITDQEGRTETFQYDREGRLTVHTDRDGRIRTRTYNMYGNPVREEAKSPDGRISLRTFQYDENGYLVKASADGRCIRYEYDEAGRLSAKKAGGRILGLYTYDKDGNVESLTDPAGRTVHYQYDAAGNRTAVLEEGRTEAVWIHDAAGNLSCVEYGNGIKTRYAYDRLGNPSRIETERGGALLADLRLFHDGNGNLTRKEGIVPGADGKPQRFLTAYTWDSKNRLASAGYGDYTEAFRYDGAGNRTARTVRRPGETEEEQFFYSPSNRLERRITHLGETAYQYDSQGNLVSEEGPAGRRIHQYDAWNREEETLTTLYGRGGVPAVSRKQKNRYNAEGLRDGLETDGRMSDFFYQGLELAGEEAGAADEKTRLLGRYVRGYGMAYADLADSEGSVSRQYFHLDQQGSTAFLTDREGQVTCTYQYDAFGAEHGQSDCLDTGEWSPGDSGATGVNRIRYTGQQYDGATGQYYLRARFYNPLLGRFLQEDVYRGDGLNLYAYCGNNPIKYYDPSGYETCDTKGKQDKGNSRIGTGTTAGGMKRTSEEWRTKYGPSASREHHLIPQALLKGKKFVRQMKKIGIDDPKKYIDRQISIIQNGTHNDIYLDGWNRDWKEWLDKNGGFLKSDLQKNIKDMMKKYKIPKNSRSAKSYGNN